MTPQDENNLERLVHQTVRGLPPRPAPGTLEARVQAEIERRAVLPWWRKSFGHWPIAARAAFAVVSVSMVKLALMAAVWAMAGFDLAQTKAAFSPHVQWMHTGLRLLATVGDFASAVLGSIPSLYLYGGLATVAALYVALFGLGAAAYRTLYASA